jgi:hypothetical protein
MHDDEMMMPCLNGSRVLVVQGDPFIAADLDLMIDDAGGKVVALATRGEDALFLIGHEPIDAAVVDPDLGDCGSASVTEALSRRNIPFVTYPPSSSPQGSLCSPWAWGLVAALAIALKLMPALEQTQFLI